MAWNKPNGSDDLDPWTSGGKSGRKKGSPPDLDVALRELVDKLGGIFGGKPPGGGRRGNSSAHYKTLFFGVILLFALVYSWMAVYMVDEKERVVVLRLGKYYETVGPGLHVYFPGFEQKFKEKVTEYRSYNLKQQMLTEDENIVEVSLSVQYNIKDIRAYVLNVSKPLISLEEATQSALRHVVGSSAMRQILTEGRERMGFEVKERLQTYIDSYGSGLFVGKVNVEKAQPPREVQAAFDDVIRAREDEERAKNRAEAYSNRIIPEARGQAKRLMEEAIGYRKEIVSKAKGESERFSQLMSEYHIAPSVTRERLYLEAIEQVFELSNKVLVDVKGGNNIMYLPLDKLGGVKSTHEKSISGGELTERDITDISNRVAEELNRRVGSSTRTEGRLGR